MNSVYMDAVFEQDTRKINLDMTSFEKSGTVNGYGGLAQLGERTLHRGDVAGSSPVASTNLKSAVFIGKYCTFSLP